MRVTIDATSALLRSAGVKSYIYHWVRHLRRHAKPPQDEICAFPFLNDFGGLDHESSMLSLAQTLPRLALLHFVNVRGNPALDRILRGSDIFHASNQVRRAPKGVKLTATLHDLTCWLMPQVHTAANVRADASFAEQILKRADGLIAVSENTRQDAIRLLKIAPDRIETIYSGVPEEYFDALPSPRPKPYVLYVGTIEPRKNLDQLLDAWKRLAADVREQYDLVIAGPQGWNSEKTSARIRAESIYLGYVPEADMPGLVAGATAFVYPSLYEGFGFPVAQAMAAGVPVLTSNTSCLPEVTGEAAVLVDPRSAHEIANGLMRLLTSQTMRDQFAVRGRARAQQFRWRPARRGHLRFSKNRRKLTPLRTRNPRSGC